MQATGFLPSRDGFSFRNDFDYPASRLGRGAPLASGFGLAGGMCLAALDRWQAGRPLPVLSAPPAPGDVLYEELVRRQIELLGHGSWDRIVDWQSRPGLGRLFGRPGVGELTRGEWSRLRRSLDRGTPEVLCLLRTRGPFANPSENPVVLAYRYEYARDAKRGTIWVYDPNRPGNDDVRLTVVPGGRGRMPEVTFVAERVRGFMILPYDRTASAPLRALELMDAEAGGFTGRATPLPGKGANVALRARNGGLMLVRPGKGEDAAPRMQRSGAETIVGSDAAVIPGAMPTIVTRDREGNLVGFRVGVRGWRPRPLPSPKAPLQIDYGPAVLAHRGRVHVFGVQKGRLAHLQRSRAGKWTAGIVPGQAAGASELLDGVPSPIVGADRVVRVFTRTEKGRIALMSLSAEGQWTTTLLPAAANPVAGDPVAVIAPDDDQISVLAVTDEGELIQIRGGGSDAWRVRNLTRETAHDGGAQPLRVEIAVTDGPGNTLHVFGVSPRNGLVHYWCPPTLAWRSEDLTHGRADVGDQARIRGRPSVVRTTDDQLVVAAAADRGIVVYRWNAAADWTGDVLPMPPGMSDKSTAEGPVLWRDASGRAHLLAVLEDGRAVLALPGRPESSHRAIRMESVAAVQPPRRQAPPAGVAVAVEDTPAEASAESFTVEAPAPIEAADMPETTLEEPAESLGSSLSLDGLGSMDLPLDDVDVDALHVDGAAEATVDLIDLGSMAVSDPETDSSDREGWGSYVDSNAVDLGSMSFEPAAPLLPAADPSSIDLDIPMGSMQSRPADVEPTAEEGERERLATAEEAERERIVAEKAEEAERERIAAEKAAAEEAERERIAAEKAAAEEAERERIAAEKAAAEEAERERIAAEKAAAEEAERQRIAAEKAAAEEAEREHIAAAEEAERERIAAEKAAAEEAERQRIAAEKAAAEEAERQRIAAEKAAAEEAERQRIAAEKAAAEEVERQRIAAEKAAAEEAERQRIAAEKAAAEEAERERIAAEKAAAEEAERERIAAEKAAAQAERERVAAEKAAIRANAEAEARRREEERAARKAADQGAQKQTKGGKRGQHGKPAPATTAAKGGNADAKRSVPAALEGLPLLDDEIKPRDPKAIEASKAEPARPAPKESKQPKPKLRSIDELIRLSDEHGPTFDKK